MAKKTSELKGDAVLKDYWRENERYADFFNAALFGGKPIIQPEDLEERDTDASTTVKNNNGAKSFGGARDNFKIRKKSSTYGIEFVMLGKESQTYIHYGMPLRIMGYDYITYKKQYDCNAAKYRTKDRKERSGAAETSNRAEQVHSLVQLDHNEFLSRMRRTDKFIPVVTAVVYYGEEPWDGAKTLHEMLQIPEEFEEYVNDYKMLLIEARNTDLVFHNADNIDFFNLMAIILNKDLSGKEIRKRAIQYGEEHQTDKAVLMAIAGATQTDLDYDAFEKGDHGMCTFFKEIAKEGEREGEVKGRAREIVETGFEFAISKEDIIKRLQNKLDISIRKATEYFNQYGRQVM